MAFDFNLAGEDVVVDDTHLEVVGANEMFGGDSYICLLHRPAIWDAGYVDDNHILAPERPRLFVARKHLGVWEPALEVETDVNFWINPDRVEVGFNHTSLDVFVTYAAQDVNGFSSKTVYGRIVNAAVTSVASRVSMNNLDGRQPWSMAHANAAYWSTNQSFYVIGKTFNPGKVNWYSVPIPMVGSSGGTFATTGTYKYRIVATIGTEQTEVSDYVGITALPVGNPNYWATKTIQLQWQIMPEADGYKIFRTRADIPGPVGESLIANITNNFTNTYVDNGSIVSSGGPFRSTVLTNSISLAVFTSPSYLLQKTVLKAFVETDVISTSRLSAHRDYAGNWHVVGNVKQTTGPYKMFYFNTLGESTFISIPSNFDVTLPSGDRRNWPVNPMMMLSTTDPVHQCHVVYKSYSAIGTTFSNVYYRRRTGDGIWGPEIKLSDQDNRLANPTSMFVDNTEDVHVLMDDNTVANNVTLDSQYSGVAYVSIPSSTGLPTTPVSVFRTSSQDVGFYRGVIEFPNSYPRTLGMTVYASHVDGTSITGDPAGTKSAKHYKNTDAAAFAVVTQTYGTAIDITRPASAAYYRVQLGEITICGGGPMVAGDTYVEAISPPGTLFVDKNYPITSSGQVTTFAFIQVNSGAAFPIVPGDIRLVVMDRNENVRSVMDMDSSQSAIGMFRYSGVINVTAGDYIGIWIAHGKDIRISASSETEGQTNMVQYDATSGMIEGLVLAGSGVTTSPSKILNVCVQSDTRSGVFLSQGYVSDGTNEDTYGYQDFVLNTNAFADGNVTSAANLFDASTATSATTAANLIGYVYYNLDAIAGLVPVESFAIHCPSIASGTKVEVYGSRDTTRAKTLAGGQAVADWRLLATIDLITFTAPNWVVSVGQKLKWVRLKLTGGTALPIVISSFEVKALTATITNGNFTVNPVGGWTRDRIFFDAASNRLCPQITGTTLSSVGQLDNNIPMNTSKTNSEFYDQLVGQDLVWFYRRVRDSGVMYYANVLSVSGGVSSGFLGFGGGIGGTVTAGVGEFISAAPPMVAYRVTAYDVSGNALNTSAWIPVTGAIATALRTHTVFSSGA